MADNISTVGSGQTFVDLDAWEASLSVIAAGDREIAAITGAVPATTVFAGITTGGLTSEIIIRAQAGQEYNGTELAGGYLRDFVGGGDPTIDITGLSDLTFRVENVEATNRGSSAHCIAAFGIGGASLITVDNCAFHDYGSGHGVNAASSVEITNSLFYNGGEAVRGSSLTRTLVVTNFVTSYNMSVRAFRYCLSTNCVAMIGGINNEGAGSDYNVTSDATAPGANSVINQTSYDSYFTDKDNGDFSLLDTSANLWGQVGIVIGGVTTDIVGTTRTSPDIGAFEFLAAVVAPDAPTSPGASAGDEEITVTWTNAPTATSHNIYFSTSSPVTTGDTKITGVTTPYVHTGRTNGVEYFYAIAGENAAGEGDLSSEVSATPEAVPDAPTNPAASGGDEEVTVSWTDAPTATSHNLYWSLSSPVTTGDNKITAVTTPYVHTGRTNGVEYFYAVAGENAGGEGDLSSEVSATPAVGGDTGPLNIGIGIGL